MPWGSFFESIHAVEGMVVELVLRGLLDAHVLDILLGYQPLTEAGWCQVYWSRIRATYCACPVSRRVNGPAFDDPRRRGG